MDITVAHTINQHKVKDKIKRRRNPLFLLKSEVKNMSVFGQRKANINYEQLDRLNSNSNSLNELKNLIKQDLGIYFTLKYYYSSLYKACFTDKNEAAKRSIENLLIRCGTRATWFQGLSVNYDKNVKETRLVFFLNPACNRAIGNMMALMETEDSNIRLSLNTLYQKEGSIFTWLNSLPDGSIEYIHIDENSYLGKIIKLLSINNIELKTFNSVLNAYKVSFKKKKICLSYLLEKNIIYTEDNILSNNIFNHLSHYKNSNLKSYLYVIGKELKKINSENDINLFLKIIEKLRNVTKVKYPLVIKEKTNVLTKDHLNLPKNLLTLFRNMTVLSEDYQFGRAYRRYFADKYGYFHPISIKEALRINQPEIINKIISEYKQSDSVMINTLNKWSNKWIELLSKKLNTDQIRLTTQEIISFSQILESAVDHNPCKIEYEFLYSKVDKKYSFKYVLPVMAFLPKSKNTTGISLSYNANIYPEIGMGDIANNQVKVNQYTEDDAKLKIEDIYVELWTDGLQFLDKSGKRINLIWNSLLETKVDGESLFVNNLKQLIKYINSKPINCIPPCYNLLFHIPRITYKNMCLSPETWNLNNKDDIDIVETINKKVGIAEGGNIFPILTKRTNWKKEILSNLNSKDSVTLYEYIKCIEPTYTQHIMSVAVGKEKKDTKEVIFPKFQFNNQLKIKFKTYTVLLPNLDYKYYIQKLARLMQNEERWFFIRYWDNGFPSLRIRTIPSEKFESNLMVWCKYYKCTFTKKNFVPEFHRYGNNHLLDLVLHHFSIESKLCGQFMKKHNSTQGRVIIESWFAQSWKECSNVPLKELYSGFSTKGISVNVSNLPTFPKDIYKSLTSIFNLANNQMNIHQQIYLYFSLVHMAQNRFYGSSEKDEQLSHTVIKKMINRGGL